MLQPVNKLPPEVLSRVAECSLDEDAYDARSIVPLTHVCQYWRESIISAPENWTLVSNDRMQLAKLSLERAKAAHLRIYLRMELARDLPNFLNFFIPHLKNTETLTTPSIPGFEELVELFSKFPRPMPNLRSLTLGLDDIDGSDPSIDPFESLPHTLEGLNLDDISLSPSLLKLRALTDLTLHNRKFNLSLDTLLDFLEGNSLLKSADLRIDFVEPSLRRSRRQTAIRNQLQLLRITCFEITDGKALISSIALSKGAELEVNCHRYDAARIGVIDILSGISTTHLSNLSSPSFMEYRAGTTRKVQLFGPNGTASFYTESASYSPFEEFPRLPLTNILRFHLDTKEWKLLQPLPGHRVFHHLSSFPTLETLTIGRETDLSRLLSPLLSKPSSSPSLKTLAFLNCDVSEDFMEELARFASDRRNTTSAWLHQILIVHRNGKFPSASSIHKLRRIVKIVEIRMGDELPTDLT